MANKKLTRRQKRLLRHEGIDLRQKSVATGIYMKDVRPRTSNQERIFDAFEDNHLMVHGYAGTGKTYVLLYLALQQIIDQDSPYEKVKIFRSAVATRNIGYLPGSAATKMESFETPYHDIIADLIGRDDAYSILKAKELVEFHPTSYIRGSTYNNSIILVDECQNLNWHEFSSLVTRVGEDSKIIFCGDSSQSDLDRTHERMDIHKMVNICQHMPSFHLVQMEIDDIVRSGFVKEFLVYADKLGYGIN